MVPKITSTSASEVGIDISEATFDACLREGDSKPKAAFPLSGAGRDQFRRWLKKHGITQAVLWMEATGRYFEELAEWALKLGWKVVVANPRAVRHFAMSKLKMNKTDKLDAMTLLRFAECAEEREFRYWAPLSAARKELRDLQVAVRGMKKAIIQERNQLKCPLKSNFAKERLRQTIKHLEAQVKALHQESMRIIKADTHLLELYKVLKPMKGIGDITIALILWKIDFAAFRKGRQLVKFAGLDSVVWQSGTSVRRKSCISRQGHADLRSGLYLPAIVAMTHDKDTSVFAKELEDRGVCKKVIICAVMARLLRIAFARVRDSQKSNAIAA